ncbi:unnamed protein product [Gongylonema pulchrum]|uniref:Uncharacterized protein n=1 Tax=Gongylonema pulchrum TaxID=637853 RepID=A0A3P6SX54_9BILA|nr:unnamed protein product [Gongylonema pulchrum]
MTWLGDSKNKFDIINDFSGSSEETRTAHIVEDVNRNDDHTYNVISNVRSTQYQHIGYIKVEYNDTLVEVNRFSDL